MDPDWGDKVNSGIALSYWQANTTTLCRSKLYPHVRDLWIRLDLGQKPHSVWTDRRSSRTVTSALTEASSGLGWPLVQAASAYWCRRPHRLDRAVYCNHETVSMTSQCFRADHWGYGLVTCRLWHTDVGTFRWCSQADTQAGLCECTWNQQYAIFIIGKPDSSLMTVLFRLWQIYFFTGCPSLGLLRPNL